MCMKILHVPVPSVRWNDYRRRKEMQKTCRKSSLNGQSDISTTGCYCILLHNYGIIEGWYWISTQSLIDTKEQIVFDISGNAISFQVQRRFTALCRLGFHVDWRFRQSRLTLYKNIACHWCTMPFLLGESRGGGLTFVCGVCACACVRVCVCMRAFACAHVLVWPGSYRYDIVTKFGI